MIQLPRESHNHSPTLTHYKIGDLNISRKFHLYRIQGFDSESVVQPAEILLEINVQSTLGFYRKDMNQMESNGGEFKKGGLKDIQGTTFPEWVSG